MNTQFKMGFPGTGLESEIIHFASSTLSASLPAKKEAILKIYIYPRWLLYKTHTQGLAPLWGEGRRKEEKTKDIFWYLLGFRNSTSKDIANIHLPGCIDLIKCLPKCKYVWTLPWFLKFGINWIHGEVWSVEVRLLHIWCCSHTYTYGPAVLRATKQKHRFVWSDIDALWRKNSNNQKRE